MQNAELAVFNIKGKYFALETEFISEIISPYKSSFMPFMPSYISGVISSSGLILPVISLDFILTGKHRKDLSCAITGTDKPIAAFDFGEYLGAARKSYDLLPLQDHLFKGKFEYRGDTAMLFDIKKLYLIDIFKQTKEV